MIWMMCEGSNQWGHDCGVRGFVLCAMCGQVVETRTPYCPEHERRDILAELDAGYYDD